MNLREQRNNTHEAILQGRFITHVLQQAGKDMDADIIKRMSEFTSELWQNRDMSVNKNVLSYTHLRQHRFIDMKSRSTLRGKIRKKFYAIHNRPLWGHANEIVKQLTVGFTDGIREQMMQLDNTEL